MAADFSFCNTLGVLEQTHTTKEAHDFIIKCLTEVGDVTDEFIEKAKNAEGGIWYGVIYQYTVDAQYTFPNTMTPTKKTVSGIGYRSKYFPESLNVTDFHGDGKYTEISNVSELKYPLWNKNVHFSLEDMKDALLNKVKENCPANVDKYGYTGARINAYFVPIYVVDVITGHGKNEVKHKMYYNLNNGRCHYEYPTKGKAYALAKKYNLYGALVRLGTILLSFIGICIGAQRYGQTNGTLFGPLLNLGLIALTIILWWKGSFCKRASYEKAIKNGKCKNFAVGSIPLFILAGISLVGLILAAVI